MRGRAPHHLVGIGIGLVSGLLAAWLCHPQTRAGLLAQGLWRAELVTYDYRLSYAPSPGPSAEIVLVTIDDESFSQPQLQRWPWPRRFHAKVIKNLKAAGARLIGVDMVLAGVSGEGGGQASQEDALSLPEPSKDDNWLTGALQSAGNVVLAMEIATAPVAGREGGAELIVGNFPLEDFEEASLGLACANMPRDLDGVVRRNWVSVTHQGESFPSMPVALAAHYQNSTPAQVGATALALGRAQHPALGGNSILVAYRAPIGVGFRRLPYYRVLENDFDPQQVAGKIALIGSTAAELHDLHYTPMALRGVAGTGEKAALMPGVEIVANTTDALLQGRYIVPLDPSAAATLTVVLAMVMAALLVWLRPLKALALGWLPLLILTVVGTFEVFWTRRLWVPVIPLLLGLTLSYGLGTIYLELTAERGQRRLRQAWAKRVSPEVLSVILNNPGLTKVGGRRLVGTVFFSDLQDFTRFCHSCPPEQVVEQVNKYLTIATQVIRAHGGTLHKFIGDGVMAVFGDPVEQPDHALRAVQAARDFLQRMRELQSRTGPGDWPMHVRIGLHTGELVAGDVGSEDMLEYTVMGDTVSTASRLEGLNKEFGTQILMSKATAAQVGEQVELIPLGEAQVRGRDEPIEVFTVKGAIAHEAQPAEAQIRCVGEPARVGSVGGTEGGAGWGSQD